MSGLALGAKARASAAVQVASPQTGQGTVTQAAFGPSATTGPGKGSVAGSLGPGSPVGLAFWVGVGSLVALVVIRHSLPR